MQITRVSKRKNRRLYDVFVDGKLAFSVSSKKVLDKFGLEPGLVIQPDGFSELKQKVEFAEAENILLEFLNYRFRSKKEIYNKLKAKHISQSVMDQLIEKYERMGYINDENFAESFMLDLIAHHPQGSFVIKQKMRQKGISNEVIERLSREHLSNDTEHEMAIKELTKRQTRYIKMDPAERRNKALAFLQRKGFSYSCAREAIEKVLFGTEEF